MVDLTDTSFPHYEQDIVQGLITSGLKAFGQKKYWVLNIILSIHLNVFFYIKELEKHSEKNVILVFFKNYEIFISMLVKWNGVGIIYFPSRDKISKKLNIKEVQCNYCL